MNNRSISLLTGFIISVISSFFLASAVWAENAPMVIKIPTESQLTKITSECSAIKTHLGKLRSNDALIRVNLGQNYETMASKVMANFNLRVVSNKLNGAAMVEKTAEFNENFNYFRDNYYIYERELTKLTNIDCQKSPTDFYAQLERVRYYRHELNFNTSMMSKIATEYYEDLEEFEQGIKND